MCSKNIGAQNPLVRSVDIPLRNAPAFLEFFQRRIGMLPIWICPIRPYCKDERFNLFPMDPDKLFLNFGFWYVVRRRHAFTTGHHNRLVEAKLTELGGIKSLYSEFCHAPDEFWRGYDGPA